MKFISVFAHLLFQLQTIFIDWKILLGNWNEERNEVGKNVIIKENV